jgi:4-amino-4-deoxy-L-arabinose transferase-like glycosyltransferase
MEWGDFGTSDVNSTISHHFSPAFAFYMAGFYRLFGYDFLVIKIASITLSLIFLLTTYLTTKSLYSKDKALVVCAFFSVYYPLIWSTRAVYSENMVLIFFTITMWAIIKGIEDDRYMVWAGLFAGLGYLTKASIGYFFIIAGGMGFLWRFYYLRWGVFRKKYYLLAIGIFLTIVGLWSYRNMIHFGFPNWETSYWVAHVTDYALGHPSEYLPNILFSAITFMILFLTLSIFFPRELRATIKHAKEEHYSGLWLAVFIVLLIGIFISGAFATVESISVFTPDRIRYIIAAFIPLSWLIVMDVDFNLHERFGLIRIKGIITWFKYSLSTARLVALVFISLLIISLLFFVFEYLSTPIVMIAVGVLCFTVKGTRKRMFILLIVLLLISLNVVTEVRYSGAESIAEDLHNHISSNDTVAFLTMNKYAIYPYLENIDFEIVNFNSDEMDSDWIISNYILSNNNYTLINIYSGCDCDGVVFSLKGLFTTSKGGYRGEPDFYLYVYHDSDE